MDELLKNFKRIAMNGSEFGPHYDRGVLSVIAQIEANNRFTPSPVAGLVVEYVNLPGGVIGEEEKPIAIRAIAESGLSNEDARRYFMGVLFAERNLSHYRHSTG